MRKMGHRTMKTVTRSLLKSQEANSAAQAAKGETGVMKKNRTMMLGGALALVGLATASALAQDWSDNFESYQNGQVLYHVGGWNGWDDVENVAGSCTNAQSHSGNKSILVEISDDAIYTFSGYTSGAGVASAWIYIPVSQFVADSFYLVQNDYVHGGPYEWCIDIEFDFEGDGGQGPGTVVDAFRPETQRVDIQFDTWVELRCEIDIDNDTIVQFYGGQEVARGQLFIRGGTPQLKNLDLFTTGTTDYYDDTAFIGFSGSGGGFDLAVDMPNGCPGPITVSWTGSPGTGQQALVVGNSQGSTTIPPQQPCSGTILGIQRARSNSSILPDSSAIRVVPAQSAATWEAPGSAAGISNSSRAEPARPRVSRRFSDQRDVKS